MRMNTPPPKAVLRPHYRAARVALSTEERAAASHALCARLARHRMLSGNIGPFAVYLPSPVEVDLLPLIEQLLAAGHDIAAPKGDGYARLTRTTGLENDARGIPVPDGAEVDIFDINLFFVPGVAFTEAGVRLGQGGGWYDRALGGKDEYVPCIGVAFDEQLADALPCEPHDVVMDYIATPSRFIDCAKVRIQAESNGA